MKFLGYIFKIVKYIVVLLLLMIFVSNFYVMIMSYLNPGTHPGVFGYTAAVVVSGSMEPTIHIDDLIIVKEQKEYFIDDIIAYKSGKSFVTHRIVEVKPQGFVTKGDANNSVDQQLVMEEKVSGKVIYVVPGVGNLIYFLRSPLGLMLMVLMTFGVMIIPEKKENINNE